MASHDDPTLGFATRAIHAGQVPDATTGVKLLMKIEGDPGAVDVPAI